MFPAVMRLARAKASVKTADGVAHIARWTRLRRVILRCDPLPILISNKRFTSRWWRRVGADAATIVADDGIGEGHGQA